MGQPPASSSLDLVNHRGQQLSVVSRGSHGAKDGNAGTDTTGAENGTTMMSATAHEVKAAARALRRSLAEHGVAITHSRALELVAHQLGDADWNTTAARLAAPGAGLGAAVPVLRVQDHVPALEFYLDYLGFAVLWEHRFEPGLPVYLRLRREETLLDLSEHHGDGTPGSVVWVPVRDVGALHEELHSRERARLRPGVDTSAPGGPTLSVTDPFGNVLRFCRPNLRTEAQDQ